MNGSINLALNRRWVVSPRSPLSMYTMHTRSMHTITNALRIITISLEILVPLFLSLPNVDIIFSPVHYHVSTMNQRSRAKTSKAIETKSFSTCGVRRLRDSFNSIARRKNIPRMVRQDDDRVPAKNCSPLVSSRVPVYSMSRDRRLVASEDVCALVILLVCEYLCITCRRLYALARNS